MQVDQAQYAGDDFLDAGILDDIRGNPVLGPLIQNHDQQGNDGVQHIFLLSAPALRSKRISPDFVPAGTPL